MRRRAATLLVLLAALTAVQLLPRPCAAGPSSKDRLEARALGAEGLELFEAGRYEEALERFQQANERYPAPTLGLRAARCLAALGRLVEASERYLEASRYPLTRQSPRVHFAARREAREERDALLPTIPTLRVEVPGSDPDNLVVRVDGERVPSALVGHPQPVDPGEHEIEVRRGPRTVHSKAALKKGDHTVMVVHLPAGSQVQEGVEASAELSTHRLWGLIALQVGGVGALVGAVHGVSALVQLDNLEARCPNETCPPDAQDEADLYDVTRVFTTVGLVIGGVGLAAGTTLLLADPGPEEDRATAAPEVTPWLGVGAVGLKGRF